MVDFYQNNLNMLDRHLYGLEEQHHKLEVMIDRFLTSQKGHSCIMYGVAKSGKVTSIRRALHNARQTHPTEFNETWIDGLEEETVGGVLARINDGRRNDALPQIIVIKKFERFAQNENQIVLYELLNSTMTKPWLVLLVSNQCSAIGLLEKRVKSRIQADFIKFNQHWTSQDYYREFENILFNCLFGWNCKQLKRAGEKKELKERENEMRSFFEDGEVKGMVMALFKVTKSMFLLKSVVGRVISEFDYTNKEPFPYENKSYMDDLKIYLKESINSFQHPFEDSREELLKNLSLRQIVLLMCFVKVSRNQNNTHTLLYKNILDCFRRLGNTYEARFRNPKELDIFSEIDYLIERGLLYSPTKSKLGQLLYKQVELTVMQDAVEKCLKQHDTLSSGLSAWLEDSNSDVL